VSFVATGDPGWQRYTTADRATMVFDATSAVAGDLRGDERRLWDGLR
jgi:para-nitrobenzyl esterase